MARIKIKDLPKDQKISEEEMKHVLGGLAWRRWIAPTRMLLFSYGLSSVEAAPIIGVSTVEAG